MDGFVGRSSSILVAAVAAAVLAGPAALAADETDPTPPASGLPEPAITEDVPSEDPALVGRLEGAGPPTASATEDGLLLELWLDKTIVPVGERLTALVRITNVGMDSPLWETNTCQTGPARTEIELSRPEDMGTAWTGRAATFKRKLLKEEWRPEILQDIDMIGLEDVGCTAWGSLEPFVPGSMSQMVLAWDATDRRGRPIQPGPATVTSTFQTWEVADRGPDVAHDAVVAEANVEVTGEPGSETAVTRYIDAALADDGFRAWVQRQRQPRWWDVFAHYWPNVDGDYPDRSYYEGVTNGAVDIGLQAQGYGAIILDAVTLDVLGRRVPGERAS